MIQESTAMTQRPEPRMDTDLPVRVWGMDSNGKPFIQHVRARNISSQGALVSGVECELKPGDIIGVQVEQKKARCRIIWVVDASGVQKNQIGLQLLEGQECPWKEALSQPAAQPTQNSSPSNRRRRARHKINFNLELRDERTNVPLRVNATDISGNGCYIETIMPMAVGTALKADFWIEEEHVNSSAIVRTCDPGVGMGIEFLTLNPDLQDRFQALLEKMDPAGISGPSHPKQGT
jgi:PilZ domain-containing protein